MYVQSVKAITMTPTNSLAHAPGISSFGPDAYSPEHAAIRGSRLAASFTRAPNTGAETHRAVRLRSEEFKLTDSP